VIYSYNKNQRDALFLKLFLSIELHVSDRFTVRHQEYSTVYMAIGICHTGYADCLLAVSQHNLCDKFLMLCIQY